MEIASSGRRTDVPVRRWAGLVRWVSLRWQTRVVRHPRPIADARNLTGHLRRDIGLD